MRAAGLTLVSKLYSTSKSALINRLCGCTGGSICCGGLEPSFFIWVVPWGGHDDAGNELEEEAVELLLLTVGSRMKLLLLLFWTEVSVMSLELTRLPRLLSASAKKGLFFILNSSQPTNIPAILCNTNIKFQTNTSQSICSWRKQNDYNLILDNWMGAWNTARYRIGNQRYHLLR